MHRSGPYHHPFLALLITARLPPAFTNVTATTTEEIASRQIFGMNRPEQPDYAALTHEYTLARGEYTKLFWGYRREQND